MQKIFLLLSFFFLLDANAAPTAYSDELITIDEKFLNTKIGIDTFLPLYGGFQIKKLITPKTWGYLMGFVKNNPTMYASFKNELASEGVFLPEFADFNMNVLLPSDYAVASLFIGDTTIEQMIKPEFVDRLVNYVQENPYVEDRLKELLVLAGITMNENLDVDAVLKTIGHTFEPFLLSFIPTALQIIIFGK